jgi:quinol monooxygenase YgiN
MVVYQSRLDKGTCLRPGAWAIPDATLEQGQRGFPLTIYMTARFRVAPDSVQASLYAINDFIDYVKANEPGTLQYTSVQDFEDSFAFLHFFAFADEAAEEVHRSSPGTTRFVDSLYPLLEGDTVFQRWNAVATSLPVIDVGAESP